MVIFCEGNDFAYDPSLPGPSSSPVGTGKLFLQILAVAWKVTILAMILLAIFRAPLQVSYLNARNGERNLQRHGKTAQALFLWPLKTFDDLNVGIQAPYKLPVDAKEIEYFKL